MQHSQVVEDHMIEQYLLDEMTEPARDEFEEHYFECRDCAAELKATAAFLDATREELRRAHLQRASVAQKPERAAKAWWTSLWSPGFGLAVAAACLLVIAYQNVMVLPKLHNEVARLEAPEVVPTLSLVGAASRGGETPSTSLPDGHAILLQVDIPAEPRFVSYTCQVYSPAQKMIGSVKITSQQAKDLVSIRVPVQAGQTGQYSLVVHGDEAAANGFSGVDLARRNFQLN